MQRFLSVDPLAADFASWSTYAYVFNNPLRFIDPTGMAPEDIYVDEDGNYLGRDGDDDNTVRVVSTETWNAVGGAEGAKTAEGTATLQDANNSTPLVGTNKETNPGWQKGINITDETWGKIEAAGGERAIPHLENLSPEHVFIKPETDVSTGHGAVSSADPPRVESGEQVYGMVDGFSTPKHPNYVWKMTTGNRVQIKKNYHVRTRGNSIGGVSARGASLLKVDGWIKENGFWHGRSGLDASWTPLYDKVRR